MPLRRPQFVYSRQCGSSKLNIVLPLNIAKLEHSHPGGPRVMLADMKMNHPASCALKNNENL